MRRRLSTLAICGLAWLSGCVLALHPTTLSAELSDPDIAFIADTIAALVADRIAAGRSIVLTDPAGDDRLGAKVKAAIEHRGYPVQGNGASTEDRHALTYLLTSYDRSVLLRVTIDGTEISCLLSRSANGGLKAETPLSVREAVR